MRTVARSRRWLVVLGILALGGVLAGSVVAARLGPPDVERLQAAIEKDPLVRVTGLPASGNVRERDVFVQLTSTGHLCLWDAPAASPRELQGGCNSADDALGGGTVRASLGYEGGPAPEDVRDARIVGLARIDVQEVRIAMSDGTARRVALRRVAIGSAEYRVFAHRIKPSDLRMGLGPVAVVAVDATGRELDRQTTGFGG